MKYKIDNTLHALQQVKAPILEQFNISESQKIGVRLSLGEICSENAPVFIHKRTWIVRTSEPSRITILKCWQIRVNEIASNS